MDQKAPVVSVVMPAYNSERYIAAAMESVLNQTLTDLELIVVDDCSTDRTYEIICGYAQKDPRVRPCQNPENSGVAATRNCGLSMSRGQYVALLDSDDLWRPTKLEKQVALAEAEQADIVYTSYALVDADGNQKCSDYLVPSTATFKRMLRSNVIGCSTVLLTREIVSKYRFDGHYYHEDYVLWMDLLQAGYQARGLREVLVDYRVQDQSRASNKRASAKHRWQIYREFLHMSILRSTFYLAQYGVLGTIKYRTVRKKKTDSCG